MRRAHVSSLDLTDAAVGGQDYYGSEIGLEGSVHVCEALDIQHVHFVDEEDAGDELSDSMIDIPVHDLVNFEAQLLCDLSFLWTIDLGHEGKEVVTTLWSRVSHIQIMECHILHDLLLLVDVSLRDWNVLFSFKIILSRVRVRSSDSLDSTTCGFNIDDIADGDFLLLNVLVDTWVEFELLLTLSGLEADNNVVNDLTVASVGVFLFLRGNIGNFTFPDFFGFFYTEANSPPKVFHEDFSLLDLGRVDFRADHGAEWHFGAEFRRNG